MHKNLAAYTPVEDMPPYISINDVGDGKVQIHVRGARRFDEAKGHHVYGPDASIEMPKAEFQKILLEALEVLK